MGAALAAGQTARQTGARRLGWRHHYSWRMGMHVDRAWAIGVGRATRFGGRTWRRRSVGHGQWRGPLCCVLVSGDTDPRVGTGDRSTEPGAPAGLPRVPKRSKM
eukprot:599216-Prymnesium_polylepis.1